MKRIVIVGTHGCGKTTLGRRITQIFNLPCFDLDEYFWLPNWQERNIEEFLDIIKDLTNKEEWVICGNFSKLRPLIWEKADTIIWLDYSFFKCLFQLFLRSLKRTFLKELCCNGNYESFIRTFCSKQSILLDMLTTFKGRRKKYNQAFANKLTNKTYYRFGNPNETNDW